MTHPLEGAAPLPHLGLIRAQGEDAAKFLHSQLTQDFALLPPGQARLAAFCNAKGRMQASFVAVPIAPGDFLLVTSRDLLAPTLKRLSMFVLRSKLRMSDASAEFELFQLDPKIQRLRIGEADQEHFEHHLRLAHIQPLDQRCDLVQGCGIAHCDERVRDIIGGDDHIRLRPAPLTEAWGGQCFGVRASALKAGGRVGLGAALTSTGSARRRLRPIRAKLSQRRLA